MSFHHITYQERLKIEALYRAKHTQAEIALQLGFTRSAISREIRRGIVEQVDYRTYDFFKTYSADKAQKHHDEQCTAKGAPLKIGHDYKLLDFIEHKIIREKYSPQAVLTEIQINNLQFETTLSKATIYNYVYSGLFLMLKKQHLPRKGKSYSNKKATPQRVAFKNALNKSINDRPKEIENRKTFGHWEMDTVIGKSKGENAVLLVLTERKTRYELIFKIPGKKAMHVTQAINRLENRVGKQKFKTIFKTITVDNGTEFTDTKGIEQNRTQVYYCHSYSSWERGSNENQNAMIRRFIPKGIDITPISNRTIKTVQNWINNYPRQLYKSTAAIEFEKELSKLNQSICAFC